MKSETRNCQNCKLDFFIEPDDFSFYEKIKVPPPTFCPECRFKMRAVWRNEMSLYSGRKCDMCKKNIISMYNSKSPYVVYCYDCYWSDKWNAKDYVVDYDFSRSFINQMRELLIKVPKLNLYTTNVTGQMVNSEYTNQAGGLKNCYFVFNADPCEDVLYSRGVKKCVDSSDLYFSTESNLSYDGVNIQKSSNCLFCSNVVSCVNCMFVLNGSGLMNCFGCVNLRNKSNCWFNQQLTPEEYSEKIKEIKGSYIKIEEAKKQFNSFCLKFPHRENNNIKSVDSSGDYLFECKNVNNSFESSNSENCKYIFSSKGPKDSSGVIGWGTNSELLLEVSATGLSSNIIGSHGIESSRNILYGFYNRNCSDCIGCVSLKNSKYSILNKEYSKEEYENLKKRIIEELESKNLYGLIMPPELSPFAYNETIAQDNFPLTKEEAISQGFRWEDDVQITKGKETLQLDEIPDNIKDINGSIISEVLKCIKCKRNYKIIEQELLFYRKMNLPIPRQCFYCRHQDRIRKRGPYKFWDKKCNKCSKDIKTNYAPERPEIVYCEKCYQQEVY